MDDGVWRYAAGVDAPSLNLSPVDLHRRCDTRGHCDRGGRCAAQEAGHQFPRLATHLVVPQHAATDHAGPHERAKGAVHRRFRRRRHHGDRVVRGESASGAIPEVTGRDDDVTRCHSSQADQHIVGGQPRQKFSRNLHAQRLHGGAKLGFTVMVPSAGTGDHDQPPRVRVQVKRQLHGAERIVVDRNSDDVRRERRQRLQERAQQRDVDNGDAGKQLGAMAKEELKGWLARDDNHLRWSRAVFLPEVRCGPRLVGLSAEIGRVEELGKKIDRAAGAIGNALAQSAVHLDVGREQAVVAEHHEDVRRFRVRQRRGQATAGEQKQDRRPRLRAANERIACLVCRPLNQDSGSPRQVGDDSAETRTGLTAAGAPGPIGDRRAPLCPTPLDLLDRLAARVRPPRLRRHRDVAVLAPGAPFGCLARVARQEA